MNKFSPKHYFMVGIGGIGMQAIADVLLGMGHKVIGSDLTDFPEREKLEAKGAQIIIGPHQVTNISSDIDELIYTSAIKKHFSPLSSHPEIAQAEKLGVPVVKRSVFVGKLMAEKPISIAVSGTHGKTTTTTLITLILQSAGLKPSALIGAEVKALSGAGIYGDGNCMVVEACEYDRSFLDMKPTIAVITNIEADHLDYYKDLDDIKQAFKDFINLVSKEGLIIAGGDDANVREVITAEGTAPIVTFGFKHDNNLQAKSLNGTDSKVQFAVGESTFTIKLPGRHLILDALAAIAVARYLKIDDKTINQVLSEFAGAQRRFEIIGTKNSITFVDDYAHHPTEIRAMLDSAKEYFKDRKIRVVFQAHQFSRTHLLIEDFAKSFKKADEVVVAPILPVRDSEKDRQLINHQILAQSINDFSHNAKALDDFDQISNYFNQSLNPGDVVISLGAGKNSEWIRNFYAQYKS